MISFSPSSLLAVRNLVGGLEGNNLRDFGIFIHIGLNGHCMSKFS